MNTQRLVWALRLAIAGLFVYGGQLAQAYDCYTTTTTSGSALAWADASCSDVAFGDHVGAQAHAGGYYVTATAWGDYDGSELTVTASAASEDEYDDEYYDESFNYYMDYYWNDGGGSWTDGFYYVWASSY